MGHRRLQPRRRGDHLVVRAFAACSRIDRDRFAFVQNGCDLVEVRIARANERPSRMNGVRQFIVRVGIGDVRRHDQHGDTAFGKSCLTGCNCLATGLFRRNDHLAIDAAALEHVIEVDLLDRLEPDVLSHDLRCNKYDRRAVAIGLIEAVDEVETAGPAGSGAGREPSRDQCFCTRGEGARLLMAHVDPIDLAAIDSVGDAVQRVTDDSVARLHAGGLQRFDQ